MEESEINWCGRSCEPLVSRSKAMSCVMLHGVYGGQTPYNVFFPHPVVRAAFGPCVLLLTLIDGGGAMGRLLQLSQKWFIFLFGVSFGPGFLLRGRNEDSKCKLVYKRHEEN